jgi:hypothetical protein
MNEKTPSITQKSKISFFVQRAKQIPKEGCPPPFLGIFPLQKSMPKQGDSNFDPCLTHTGFFIEK